MKKQTSLAKKPDYMAKIESIAEKLAQIKTVNETIYKTNGEIKWGKIVYSDFNVHRCTDIGQLITLLGHILNEFNMYEQGAKALKLTTYPAFSWMGFNLESWQHDITVRISQLFAKEQIEKLNKAKSVLESFMSNDDRLAIVLKELEDAGI